MTKKEMVRLTCQKCIYSHFLGTSTHDGWPEFECRKSPPIAGDKDQYGRYPSVWPYVMGYQWCSKAVSGGAKE